jgi:hypothetical protein
MADAVADIAIGITADISPLMRETARAGKAVNKFGADMARDVGNGARGVQGALGQASAAAASFGKSFVGGLALGVVSAGMAAVTTNIRATIGAIADMADEAQRVGLTTDEFQGLAYGMKLAGVQADEFASGLSKFTDNLGDAARGTGKLKDVLEANGIALRDVDGGVRSTGELLSDFADMIQRVPDEATRMSLITDAFGKGGKAMTLALAGGAAGLAEMEQAARDAGVVLDGSIVTKAAELDDKFDALTARVQTFFKEVSVGAAGAAVDLAEMVAAGLTSDAATPNVDLGASYDTSAAAGAAERLSDALGIQAAVLLEAEATYDAALAVMDLSSQIDDLTVKLQAGSITFEDYQAGLGAVASQADGMFAGIEDANGLDLSDARAQIKSFLDLMGGMFGTVSGLGSTMSGLTDETEAMADAFRATAAQLDAVGNTGAADAMRQVAQEIDGLAGDFRTGEIDGETFRSKLDDLVKGAGFAVSALGDIDGVTFGGVNTAINGVIGYLDRAITRAQQLRDTLPAAPGAMEGGGRAEPAEYVSTLAPKVSPRPQQPGIDSGIPDAPTGSAGPSAPDLDALLASLETEKEILDGWYAESQAMLANATDAQLAQIGGRHEAIQRLEQEHQERLASIRGIGDDAALGHTASFFGRLAGIIQGGGEKANKAYKIFAAAEALINAYRASNQVLADPTVPAWLKLPMRAAIWGQGLIAVKALGGSGGSGGGSSRAPSQSTAAAATPAIVNMTINGKMDAPMFRSLTEQLNAEFKQGYVLNVVAG